MTVGKFDRFKQVHYHISYKNINIAKYASGGPKRYTRMIYVIIQPTTHTDNSSIKVSNLPQRLCKVMYAFERCRESGWLG